MGRMLGEEKFLWQKMACMGGEYIECVMAMRTEEETGRRVLHQQAHSGQQVRA